MSRSPLSKYRKVAWRAGAEFRVVRPVLAYIERDGTFIATKLDAGDHVAEKAGEQLWLPKSAMPPKYV